LGSNNITNIKEDNLKAVFNMIMTIHENGKNLIDDDYVVNFLDSYS